MIYIDNGGLSILVNLQIDTTKELADAGVIDSPAFDNRERHHSRVQRMLESCDQGRRVVPRVWVRSQRRRSLGGRQEVDFFGIFWCSESLDASLSSNPRRADCVCFDDVTSHNKNSS